MDIEHYKKRAQEKHSQQKKTLQKLKKNPPKNLDQLMQKTHQEVFSEVDCLACANCCTTTGPLFTSKDIERLAKKFRLKPSQFIDAYLRVDEDGDHVLQQLPCPFLGAENYCTVYEERPKACREFPHTDRKKFYQINDLTIQNCKICPAAYLVVCRLEKLVN